MTNFFNGSCLADFVDGAIEVNASCHGFCNWQQIGYNNCQLMSNVDIQKYTVSQEKLI